MEKKLREFLQRYIGQGEQLKDKVFEEDVEIFIQEAVFDGIEQEVIDYGTAHPEAPFWDFLKMLKPGLFGVTQEELLEEDD